MIRSWKTLSRRYLFKSPWMNVRADRVRLSGGQELEAFHVVELPDWVCVLCFTEEGEVLMVEQYRHGVERTGLELPAGAIDPGEEPLAAAQRELLEETGYAAEEWALLGRCAPEPSKHTNYAYLFVAHQARHVRAQHLDATEDINVHLMPPEELIRRADAGEILHGIHLTTLFWAQHRGMLP